MLLVKRQWWAALAALSMLALIGCTVRSQHATAPPPTLPLNRLASPNPSPPEKHGLLGVIPGPSEIVPGRSVGALRLGETRERSLDLFGKPNEEYTFDDNSMGPCRYTEAHWSDLEHEDRWGMLTYLKNSHIYQIVVDTPRYATRDGLTSDSSPREVRARFPNSQAYVLLHSGSKMVGGKDLIYWVDQTAGIAFEFYYHRKLNQRRVGNIIVFEPRDEFLPAGCISPPQEFRKLQAFAVESPVE